MKILLLDIETGPNLAWVWEKYEQDVIAFKKERELLSFAYKWVGDKKVQAHCLHNSTPLRLTKKLWELFNEADVIVAHNGDSFDIKMANAFFAHLGLKPPSPYKTIDTLKIARNKFRFNSNKLNDLGKYLNLGEKVDTGGFKLWLGCLEGSPISWKKMVQYNKRDVELLEKVYLVLMPWGTTSISTDGFKCPSCGSQRVQRRGWGIVGRMFKKQRYQCVSCGRWSSSNCKVKYNTGEYLV
mgnify:CR=1 FL=1